MDNFERYPGVKEARVITIMIEVTDDMVRDPSSGEMRRRVEVGCSTKLKTPSIRQFPSNGVIKADSPERPTIYVNPHNPYAEDPDQRDFHDVEREEAEKLKGESRRKDA